MAFISKKIEDLINFRILEEEKSSRLYLAMAKWLRFNGYEGAAKLWEKYSEEELIHTNWAYTYLEDLDIKPIVPSLPEPKCEYASLSEICKLSYDHELLVTKQCNDLAKASQEEGDFMTLQLAQKYLAEQTEEIMRQTHWLNRIELLGGESITNDGLYLLDKEMGKKA